MLRRFCTWTTQVSPKNVDFERLFTEKRVQDLLKNLTGMDASKVFNRFHTYKPKILPEKPVYILASEADLTDAEIELKKRCQAMLKFPPFKLARPKDKVTILSKDPELAGFDNAKIIFTDTSRTTTSEHDRLIVVREPDGTLRTANNEEHYRMIRIFYPKGTERISLPILFKEPFYTEALESKKYRIILDWACLQLEPDDAKYIKIAKTVYDHCNGCSSWDVLWSTRHYGNFVFYLVINKNHENLLQFYIDTERLDEAINLVHLFYICHPEHKSLLENFNSENVFDILMHYAKKISSNKSLIKSLDHVHKMEMKV